MGKKKGNTNEADVADTGAGALEQAVSQEHGEQAAAALVDDDGGTAVDPPAGEHAAEPAAAAEQPEAGEHDAQPQDEAPADAADVVETPPGEKSERVNDGHGEITGHAGDVGTDGVAGDEGAASVDELGGERDPAGGSDLGNGVAMVGEGDDGSAAGDDGRDDVRNRDADASLSTGVGGGVDAHDMGSSSGRSFLGEVHRGSLLETPPIEGPGKVSDGITLVAHIAGSLAAWLQSVTSGEPMPDTGILSLEMGEQLYAFVDKIRERATPDVLASQLVILKQWEQPDLNIIERVTLDVFTSFALIMLKQEDEIVARQRAEAEWREPVPVPIDETTMETADEPLATWGR